VLLIPCPWCGPRAELEFAYGGQAGIAYPPDPEALTDDEWAAYLFLRDNPRGELDERWVHTAGCRRWFRLRRNTGTNAIRGSSPMFTAEGPAAGPSPPHPLP
jgi:heterotetrameric sarcosine oxidase delta subunit